MQFRLKDPARRAAALTLDFLLWSSHPSSALCLFCADKCTTVLRIRAAAFERHSHSSIRRFLDFIIFILSFAFLILISSVASYPHSHAKNNFICTLQCNNESCKRISADYVRSCGSILLSKNLLILWQRKRRERSDASASNDPSSEGSFFVIALAMFCIWLETGNPFEDFSIEIKSRKQMF